MKRTHVCVIAVNQAFKIRRVTRRSLHVFGGFAEKQARPRPLRFCVTFMNLQTRTEIKTNEIPKKNNFTPQSISCRVFLLDCSWVQQRLKRTDDRRQHFVQFWFVVIFSVTILWLFLDLFLTSGFSGIIRTSASRAFFLFLLLRSEKERSERHQSEWMRRINPSIVALYGCCAVTFTAAAVTATLQHHSGQSEDRSTSVLWRTVNDIRLCIAVWTAVSTLCWSVWFYRWSRLLWCHSPHTRRLPPRSSRWKQTNTSS